VAFSLTGARIAFLSNNSGAECDLTEKRKKKKIVKKIKRKEGENARFWR